MSTGKRTKTTKQVGHGEGEAKTKNVEGIYKFYGPKIDY